jgi:integrase
MPAARAFKMWAGKGGEMLERDLKAAGIAKVDESGGIVDFHSLRHTFGTLLAASGVHPKVAQDLMRHSTITLTMGIYTHTNLENRMGALDKLPDLRAAKGGDQGVAFG